MHYPTSAPPQIATEMAPGRLFFSSTDATMRDVAIVVSGVDGAPFLF